MTTRTPALAAALIAAMTLAACTRSAPVPAPAQPPHAASTPGTQSALSASTALAGPAAASTLPPVAAPRADGSPLIADSIDRVHIEYHVYGSGEPAVVLIHGWACDSSYWHAQLDELKAHYTVVTLDLAGHGASGRNRTEWSMANYGEDVAAVARHIPNARIVLVGHSMGGPVALEAAPRIGQRVIGIIGVDTFKGIGLPPPARSAVDQQVAPFRTDFIGEMHRFVPQFLFTRKGDAALARKVADDMARESPQVALSSLLALNTLDYGTLLPLIHVPIIAINSDLGEITDVARIRRAVPDFRAVTLKGAGHFLMLEDPQHFNPLLLKAIDSLGAQ
jgi:pimeloyl-ACP methyl ester carboxylesterase